MQFIWRSKIKIITSRILILLGFPFLLPAQSPYRTSCSIDGWLLGTGSAITVSVLLSAQEITPLSVQEINLLSPQDVTAFDRAATNNYSQSLSRLSDILVSVNAASALLLLLDQDIRSDWRTLGIMSAETALLVTTLPMLIKEQVQRIRPYVYNPEVALSVKTRKDAKLSFFSGHTTLAFASTVFISTVYSDYFPHSKWKTPVWTGGLLLASTIGLLRFESGQHFPTDIFTGAAVGSVIGYVVPALHRISNKDLNITAVTGDRGLRMGIQYQF